MAEMTVQRRMQTIEKLAVQDDDGAWDPGEIRMLAEAARNRYADQFAPEGVAYMTALYKNKDTQYAGDGKKTLLDVLVKQARVDRGALAEPGEPVELGFKDAKSDKFYKLAVEGTTLVIEYGRTGTAGQKQEKKLPSHAAALKEYDKKLQEKLREGYTFAGAEAEAAAPVEAPAEKNKLAITKISWSKLEDQIEKVYGVAYDIVPSEEWGNDSEHFFEVEKKPLDEYDRESVEDWKKEGDGNYILGSILQDMCVKGHLEPGNYLVTVCW